MYVCAFIHKYIEYDIDVELQSIGQPIYFPRRKQTYFESYALVYADPIKLKDTLGVPGWFHQSVNHKSCVPRRIK